MQTLTQPTLLLKPFAESGDKNTLPDVNTDLSNPQNADLTNGFPQITSMKPSDGGLPPQREDFNALGYLTTAYDFFYQAGGTFTFDPTISTAIGGYPLGARLWYTDSNGVTMILRSTVQNNTDNFNDGNETGIGTTWVSDTPTLGGNNSWTGSNTMPSPPAGDNSTKVATTAWVAARKCTTPATTTSSATGDLPAIVVENYFDSTNGDWYRIWSDGWIEQGGIVTTGGKQTINLLKPFSNTEYTVVSSSTIWATVGEYDDRTNTSFTHHAAWGTAGISRANWMACGY